MNIQSLIDKLENLEVLLHSAEGKADVVCITEHWLKKYEIDQININGYKIVDSFCRDKTKRGGSCIIVKDMIETVDISFEAEGIAQEKIFELSITKLKKPELVIACIYRIPDESRG